MGKRKRVPLPSGSRSWRPITSKRVARQVTSEFHNLTQDLEKARAAASSGTGDEGRIAALEASLAKMGGRHRYQKASALTTEQNRSTARFVTGCVERLGLRPKSKAPPLATLEVGAVNTQLLSVPFLDVRAVDLHSIDPRIEQRDFFDIAPTGALDVLVNGMVINCVESAAKRGEMLLRCRAHLRRGGLLVIVLPRRCVCRSKYTTEQSFEACLGAIGFELRERRDSPKIAFWCFEKVALAGEDSASAASAPWVPLAVHADLAKRFPHPARQTNGRAPKKMTGKFALSFPAIEVGIGEEGGGDGEEEEEEEEQ
jgi:25S rRNA (adenine2142-N1)-methyltransferase